MRTITNIILTICLCLSTQVSGQMSSKIAAPTIKGSAKQLPYSPIEKANSSWTRSKRAAAGTLAAQFTVKSQEEFISLWSASFDQPTGDWTFTTTNSSSTNWIRKSDLAATKRFSSIDPTDVASLFIEGHYRLPKETAGAISPVMHVTSDATLIFYAGLSLNWKTYCTVTLHISNNRGATWSKLWDTSDLPTDAPAWKWYRVEKDMKSYSNQDIQLKWEYVGYMGDFILDGVKLIAPSPITHVDVMTGDKISLVDQSSGSPTSWQWEMPGATPSRSTDRNPEIYYTRPGNYDISLLVTDATGESSSVTMANLVTVESTKPIAKIIPPATFREWSSRLPFVAPMADVVFTDGSTGYPTSWTWGFSGLDKLHTESTVRTEQNPVVNYNFRKQQSAILVVENDKGISQDEKKVFVDYSALVSNVMAGDTPTTFDLGDGFGFFPGTNKLKITEYAERFSRPSRPALFYGVNLFFTYVRADELYEQIQSVKVSLCKSTKEGLPGQEIDFASWSIFELDPANGSAVPTTFEFTKPILIDEEFFIVVSGLPELSDVVDVRMAMAKFRDHDNTAYLKTRDGWRSASSYFPAGANHTSYYVTPLLEHWALTQLNDSPITVGPNAGIAKAVIFSTLGYKTPTLESSWCRVVGQPNGLTVDTIQIQYDQLPKDVTSREAIMTLNNGYESISVSIKQESASAISSVENSGLRARENLVHQSLSLTLPTDATHIEVWNLQGQPIYRENCNPAGLTIDCSQWPIGSYIVRAISPNNSSAIRIIKQ